MFNLNDYEDVDTRIHKFYETYEDGAILTELITMTKKKGLWYFERHAFGLMWILSLPLLVMHEAAAKIVVLTAIFGLKIARHLQLGDAWQISDYLLRESEPSSLEMAKVADAQAGGNKPIRVRTQEQKEFLSATNKEAEIIWDTTIEPPADVEPAFTDAVDLIQQTFTAEPVPQCKHGSRVLREGTGKNGAYRGWGCPIPMRNKAEQCKMIWMILDPSGKWSFRPEDEATIAG